MKTHGSLQDEEANAAAWEAGKGALLGAAKWGAGAAILGAIGYVWSPIYRNTTVQFKVYLQMSGMVLGGMIEADWRLRQYEYQMRMQRRWLREKAKWERYEQEFSEKNDK
ncbi:hypothetical protein JDV02_005185 [Purpureocillium takamizusanense]|uniref:Imidazoleglycerol-phosphate dehydratase n=1 Tax=Purpureocillium takamizusanense TaxID=2060973 RepID=A0A9Q8QGU2_9HYPO|nr:uncharacterized protein JDV02_005185 [Purpureocillium takamizusanense]UNI18956.1 hypothetical protein JDV02_005185 [Purpureocillium takamizusanense]